MKKILLLIIPVLIVFACMYPEFSGADYGGAMSGDYYPGTEQSEFFEHNPFVLTETDHQSTFALDVDEASYTFHRKKIMQEQSLPYAESVRVEEFVNYFDYDYPAPETETFTILPLTAPSPFKENIVNLVVGLKGRIDSSDTRKPWNLTFLVDTSGSMTERLSLVKKSLGYLIDGMQPGDRISITTYAGSVSTVLMPTTIAQKDKNTLKGLLNDLTAGGGTAMSDGMKNAYSVNQSGFLTDGVNRVIVCSDGDANIGHTGWDEMLKQVREYVEQGITLTTLGFGIGNYQDGNMEMLADKGNGNYYYIDSETEAKRLFSDDLISVMNVIAADSKIQIDFNSSAVKSYRLLGYENRAIADDDFTNDDVDAGEVGEGHTVTAVYELILHEGADTPEKDLGTVSLRFRDNAGAVIQQDVSIVHDQIEFSSMSADFKMAVTCAEYADILRQCEYTQTTLSELQRFLETVQLGDSEKRQEFRELVRRAAQM